MKEREESIQRFGIRANSEVKSHQAVIESHDSIGEHSPKISAVTPVKSLTVLEELEMRFGNSKSKTDVVKALETCDVLHRIPLPEPSVALEQALKDFYREKVLLNDVAFIPDKHDDDRSHGFSQTLHILLERMTRTPDVYNIDKYGDFKSVGNLLMQRACRTSAGADSFFTVQKLLCVEGTFLTQKTLDDDPPVLIDVFLAPQQPQQQSNNSVGGGGGEACLNSTNHSQSNNSSSNPTSRYDLCARVQVSNCFAIFDVDSVDEITGIEAEDPRPWLDVESVVVDETNFQEGVHWRKLHLIVTNPETGVTYTSNDTTSALNEALRSSGRISSRRILHDLSSWFISNRPTSNRTDDTMLTTHSSVAGTRGDHHSEVSSVQGNNRNSRRLFAW